MQDSQFYGKRVDNMANWQADNILVPQGKDEQLYKYNYAHARIKQLIMNS